MAARQPTDEILSGIYLVTLNNDDPISANAHDRRLADKAIKVKRGHCKIGGAKNLSKRRKDYLRTFGAPNVNFMVLAVLDEFEPAERTVLAKLDANRIRGATGRKNEWLEGIEWEEVKRVTEDVIRNLAKGRQKRESLPVVENES